MVSALSAWPQVTVFVEIKQESIDRFGSRFTVARVLEALQPCMDQCVVISFAAEAVAQASELGATRIGWAIRQFNGVMLNEAKLLAPQFLFCDHKTIPAVSKQSPHPFWHGPWQWAIYEVGNPGLAIRLAEVGADMIETFEIGTLIRHPRLAPPEVSSHYDIVVIGGGINGTGVAQAAAAAGHSVLLLEKSTLGEGTSSRSSKLIHGGLRYLESMELWLVRESLHERTLMLRLAPELAHLRRFHIPVYKATRRPTVATANRAQPVCRTGRF